MRKELRPTDEVMACGSCGRTILKGERTELYFTPEDAATVVCELCVGVVEREGWLRESQRADMPPARRQEPRRSLWDRLRRPREDGLAENGSEPEVASGLSDTPLGGGPGGAPTEDSRPGATPPAGAPASISAAELPNGTLRPKDPRHVRAVPMTAEVKVEHALELFNSSEHRRTVAGIARSLGAPWVSAAVLPESSSEVAVVVGWEFSWYRYRIDLTDVLEPVTLVDKGRELAELNDQQLAWNGSATLDGRLTVGVGADR